MANQLSQQEQPAAQNLMLLKRTIFGVLDFYGRSRRREVIYYWFAAALLSAVIKFEALMLLPVSVSSIVAQALEVIWLIPIFALFARRMHDQNRSGWWALLLPAYLAISFALFLVIEFSNPTVAFEINAKTLVWLVRLPLTITLLVMLFMPGTNGPNKFGEDPRQG